MRIKEDVLINKDFKFAIQILRLMFTPAGIWPFTSRVYSNPLKVVIIITVVFLQISLTVPAIMYILFVLKTLTTRMKLLGSVSYASLNFTRYLIFVINRRQFANYLTHMAIDWHRADDEQSKKIMIEKAQTARFLMLVVLGWVFTSGILFCSIMPLSMRPYVVSGNETFYHLPLDAYFMFFNAYQKKYFDYIYLAQCMAIASLYIVNSGVCNVTIQGILHISSQCLITTVRIKELAKNFNNKSLGKIIKHHWRSLRLAFKMQDMMNEIFLVEFLISMFCICFVGFYMIMDLKNNDMASFYTYSTFLISFTFNIYIFCYLGEHLTEQYENVGSEVFTLDWYNLQPKQVRDLQFLILFAQRPVYLSAGKLVNFSVPTFTNVMKASATYMNMFRALTLT